MKLLHAHDVAGMVHVSEADQQARPYEFRRERLVRLIRHTPIEMRDHIPMALYMVIEHFKGGDALPVYRRFRDEGRLAPDGLTYVSSWVDATFERCYQLMETDNALLLDQWIGRWRDLVDFEVHHVISSAEAREQIAPRL